jgi:hypothetical protein
VSLERARFAALAFAFGNPSVFRVDVAAPRPWSLSFSQQRHVHSICSS